MKIWKDPISARLDELEAANQMLRQIVAEASHNHRDILALIDSGARISASLNNRLASLEARAAGLVTSSDLMQLFPEKFS